MTRVTLKDETPGSKCLVHLFQETTTLKPGQIHYVTPPSIPFAFSKDIIIELQEGEQAASIRVPADELKAAVDILCS